MPSPFVVALREARARIASAADPASVDIPETGAARRLVRELDRTIARLEGEDGDRELISIVCHDLKDPLASIVMGAAFLRRTVAQDDGPVRRVVEAISRSADRMNQTVGDFHDLARLDAGSLPVDRQPCDVGAALGATRASWQALASERGLHLDLDLPRAPLVALCDRARVLQIVSKLLGNAYRFTGASGRVVVRAWKEEELVWVSVADSGRGIAADRISTIFEHAANARRTPRDGPGLGLAIVRGLVELQGGKVHVESRVDAGSVFSFALPAAPAPPEC
jgi:two-component system phosphate regulon sensor histidine kinase PhoR